MPAIFKFPIPEAYVERIDGGIKVTLHYPRGSERDYTTERRYSGIDAIEFGIDCLERLQRGERVRIGTPDFPSRPPSGGLIDVLSDGDFYSHRRDGGTKVHPLHHGIPSGFPGSEEYFSNIYKLQKKEGAEEAILFTADGVPYVPTDIEGRIVTEKRLVQLGLDPEKAIRTPVEYDRGSDIIEIIDGDSKITFNGLAYLSWEMETNVTLGNIRYWPKVNPQDVEAVDVEFAPLGPGGTPINLNREMFRFSPSEVADKKFGDDLVDPRVYRLVRVDGRQRPALQLGYPVWPYKFKPDDGLRRSMDEMKIPGYYGLWLPHEIGRAKVRLEELKRAA